MNARQLSIVLLLLNLGLLGVVFFLATQRPANHSGDPSPAGEGAIVTNTITQIAVRKINATNLFAALANRPMSWLALESTNYFVYAQNLRNFGCPEETVRDIIVTDVAKFYGQRRQALRAQGPLPEYWKPSPNADGSPAESPELAHQIAELNREEDHLVQELLGVEREAEVALYVRSNRAGGPVVSFLPEAKRGDVAALHARYAVLTEAITQRASGLLLETDRQALLELQKQRETLLAQLLTPEELVTYNLYNSETANRLRSGLAGFNATQDEFNRIFQLEKSFADQYGAGAAGNETSPGALAATQTLQASLQQSLGPQRYAEYQRAQDGDYRTLLQLADRYQLSAEAANNVYTMKLTAERQKRQVESTPNLTDVQRTQALAKLAEETERSVATVLGGALYKDYQNGPGQWLNNLYFFNEENLPPEPAPESVQNPPRRPMLPPLPPGILNSLPPGYRELLLNTPGALPPGPPPPGGPIRP